MGVDDRVRDRAKDRAKDRDDMASGIETMISKRPARVSSSDLVN